MWDLALTMTHRVKNLVIHIPFNPYYQIKDKDESIPTTRLSYPKKTRTKSSYPLWLPNQTHATIIFSPQLRPLFYVEHCHVTHGQL